MYIHTVGGCGNQLVVSPAKASFFQRYLYHRSKVQDFATIRSMYTTWWLIPLSKWVITPVINGISRVNPLNSLGL